MRATVQIDKYNWQNVKGFRYLYEDELKRIGKKINELFEKNNVKN